MRPCRAVAALLFVHVLGCRSSPPAPPSATAPAPPPSAPMGASPAPAAAESREAVPSTEPAVAPPTSESEAMAMMLPASFRCGDRAQEQPSAPNQSLSEDQRSFIEVAGRAGAPLATRPMPPGIRGSLPKAAIRERIASSIGDVRWCYETAQTWKPDVAGRVVVRFVIAPDGGVANAAVDANDTGFEDLGCCIARKVSTWTFPAPEGGGIVLVTYPFVLTPAGAAGAAGEP